MTDRTNAERQAALRARRKRLGLVAVYVPKAIADKVRKYAARLMRRTDGSAEGRK